MSNDFRAMPRYFMPNGLPAMLDELEVSVVDLSIKGARLQLTMPVPVGATVPLVIMGIYLLVARRLGAFEAL